MNTFDRLNDWIRDTESSIVNIVSAIAPWLAPLAPAFMTYQHAKQTLGFPEWVAIPGAVTVEILGFSTVSTYLAFWFHNRKNSAETKKAPLGIVIFAFIFYLSLIIVSNVILDASDGAKWAVIVVRALFTLQSIPAALIVAVRHTRHSATRQVRMDQLHGGWTYVADRNCADDMGDHIYQSQPTQRTGGRAINR